jgi:tetratricopeptide (TPR) repeat protein
LTETILGEIRMQIKSTYAFLIVNEGKLSQQDVKGQLTLTTEEIRFEAKSKRVPDLVIPLDSIYGINYSNEGIGRYIVAANRKIANIIRSFGFNFKDSSERLYLILNTGEEAPFIVPHRLEWNDAILDAIKNFAKHFFSDLPERTKRLIADKRFSEAKTMLKDVLEKLSDPAYMAFAYSCLSTVHWADGDMDKAHEAYVRAKALLSQCKWDSELIKTISKTIDSKLNEDMIEHLKNSIKDSAEQFVKDFIRKKEHGPSIDAKKESTPPA